MSENLLDAHTFSLDFQGNIYTVTSIQQSGTFTTKLIVATLTRKVYSVELSMSHCARPCGCVVVPQSQEIQFTYIPSGAEIISIDAFNRSKQADDFVIGVTIIKSAESGSPGQYLNIYSDWDVMMDQRQLQSLENLAQSCISLSLDFTPYQLTHWQVGDGTVWLLGGSDRRVHVYSEDKAKHMYQEVDPAAFLPEFSTSFPSVPLWTDLAEVGESRVTATGCGCGLLVVTSVSTSHLESLQTWHKEFAGPVTSTRLFSVLPEPLPPPAFLQVYSEPEREERQLDLCVAHSLGQTEVFRDILQSGLTDCSPLPESDLHDVVTTICVADVDMKGQNDLILGTYGHQLLSYRHSDQGWSLAWTRSLSAPVLGLRWEDVTGDGVRELVVVTTRGVQVLQSQLDHVKEVTLERLKKLVKRKKVASL